MLASNIEMSLKPPPPVGLRLDQVDTQGLCDKLIGMRLPTGL